MKNNWQVATAAEAMAAAQFARLGYDVSVQYGANQPEYDLIISSGPAMLKVSVKGSRDGGWGLTQKYIREHGYAGAVNEWLKRHSSSTIFCLVQFKNVPINEIPRMYIATPKEIAAALKSSSGGRGHSSLRENHTWTKRSKAAGTTDRIPDTWRFSAERVTRVLQALRRT